MYKNLIIIVYNIALLLICIFAGTGYKPLLKNNAVFPKVRLIKNNPKSFVPLTPREKNLFHELLIHFSFFILSLANKAVREKSIFFY